MAVIVLTAIEGLFAMAAYHIGKQGLPAVQARFPKVGLERWTQIGQWYERWGAPLLLLTAIPVLNPLLTVTAGVNGIGLYAFLFWGSVGKAVRTWLIILLSYGMYQRL